MEMSCHEDSDIELKNSLKIISSPRGNPSRTGSCFNLKLQQMANPLDYLEVAYNDLLSSKLLYKNKLFPQALYFSAQAVEKTCKYFILKDNLLSEDELKRKIGHDSFKTYKFLGEYFSNALMNNPLTKRYNEDYYRLLKSLETKSKEYINQYNNSKNETRNLFYDEKKIDYYLIELNLSRDMQLHAQAYDPLFENTDDLLQLIIDLKFTDDQTIQYIRENINDKHTINNYKQLLEELKVKIPEYQNIQLRLIKLAEVFSIIKDNVRYPDISSNWIPYKVFTETNPFILRLEDFNEHIESVIIGLKEIGF